MTNVTPLPTAHRMSEADYDRERAALRATYGDSSVDAAAKRDQALAHLFYRSNWTQEELAKKEDKSPQRIAQSLRFGRFLDFSTVVEKSEKPPHNLTERRFRAYWEQTDKRGGNERQRFMVVLDLMRGDTALMRTRRDYIGKDIIKEFADGKWHRLDTIIAKINADESQITETLRLMGRPGGTHGGKAERKQAGQSISYRIFRNERQISTTEIAEKLAPIIEHLKAEGKKNTTTMSPGTVARLAALLQQQLDEWCGKSH